jgi:hypothetical protein
VIDQPRGKEIHVIADNQSAHKSRPVTDFLAVHPKVHLHFTPPARTQPLIFKRIIARV